MTRFFSEPLDKHPRTAFHSGDARIDYYFRETVAQDISQGNAVCYLLLKRSSDRIAGFYTLSPFNIPLGYLAPGLSRTMPRYPSLPVVLIGWMGRDMAFQGMGIGSLLLYDALQRIVRAPVGVSAIFAEGIDDNVSAFYRRHLFQPLANRPQTLFLPMQTALTLVSG